MICILLVHTHISIVSLLANRHEHNIEIVKQIIIVIVHQQIRPKSLSTYVHFLITIDEVTKKSSFMWTFPVTTDRPRGNLLHTPITFCLLFHNYR